MCDKDDLDLLIDAALTTYADPSPSRSLEHRILQSLPRRLESQAAARRLSWLAWSAAFAAAACILALILFHSTSAINPVKNAHQAATDRNPPKTNATVANSPTPATATRTPLIPHKSIGLRVDPPAPIQTAKAAPLPKLDVFPTPAPLDEQVEALAFFVRRAPPDVVKQLLEKRAQADAPLEAKELEIPPLPPLNEGGK